MIIDSDIDLPGAPAMIFERIDDAIQRGHSIYDGSIVSAFQGMSQALDAAMTEFFHHPSTPTFRLLVALWTQVEIALDGVEGLSPTPELRRA